MLAKARFITVFIMPLAFLISCHQQESNALNQVDKANTSEAEASYFLVKTVQGLMAVDPENIDKVRKIADPAQAEILIPQSIPTVAGSEVPVNRMALFSDHSHFYRLDLKKRATNLLKPVQVSTENKTDQVCALFDRTDYHGALRMVNVLYYTPGPDKFCAFDSTKGMGDSADNGVRYINLAMTGKADAANHPVREPRYRHSAPYSVPKNQREFPFFEYRVNQQDERVAAVVAKLALKDHRLYWYPQGNNAHASVLMDAVSSLSIPDISIYDPATPLRERAQKQFLRINDGLYHFDYHDGTLSPRLYRYIDATNFLDPVPYTGTISHAGNQYAFIDNRQLIVVDKHSGQWHARPLIKGKALLGNASRLVGFGDRRLIVFDDDSQLNSDAHYVSIPRAGGKMTRLAPLGYHLVMPSNVSLAFQPNRFLFAANSGNEYIVSRDDGKTIAKFSGDSADFVRSLDGLALFVENYQMHGHLKVYNPFSDKFDIDFGQLRLPLAQTRQNVAYYPLGKNYAVLGMGDRIFLYKAGVNTQLPNAGAVREVMPSVSGKSLLAATWYQSTQL